MNFTHHLLQQEPEAEECTAHSKQLKQWTLEEKATKTRHSRSRHANENVHSFMDKKDNTMVSRRSRKRRSSEKVGAMVSRMNCLPIYSL